MSEGACVHWPLKLVSLLLRYPEDSVLAALPEIRSIVEAFEDDEVRILFRRFMNYCERSSLLHLKAAYTETFDMNAANCLDLTYHKWGESEHRGPALARFEAVYKQAGVERACGELPDHLPLVLEFASHRPAAELEEITAMIRPELETVLSRLVEAENPYADLLEIAARILPRPSETAPAETTRDRSGESIDDLD